MKKKREAQHDNLLPEKGNPICETVCHKIGGTVFKIETSCGGSELLYDKMTLHREFLCRARYPI